jgi:hypothetical protein
MVNEKEVMCARGNALAWCDRRCVFQTKIIGFKAFHKAPLYRRDLNSCLKRLILMAL